MRRNFLFEVLLVSAFAASQLSGNTAAWFKSSKSVQGVVEHVEADLIKLHPQSANLNAVTLSKVNVNINAETILKDIPSLAELKEGDEIQIKYKEENEGTKIAMEIAKLEPADESIYELPELNP